MSLLRVTKMYLIRISLIFLLSISSFSYGCIDLTDTSGIINHSFNKYMYRETECWTLNVPEGHYMRIKVERFSSSHSDCSDTNIKVKVGSGRETYDFCPSSPNNQPIVAFGDVVIQFETGSSYRHNHRSISFALKYDSESILCAQKDSFTCSPGDCIAHSQVCDGSKDCRNGADEKGCETGVFAVEGVDLARSKALRWMREEGSYSSGWKENTHRAVISLHLATERNSTNISVMEELYVKQLQTQTLVALLRNNTDPVTTNQLSMFVNALLVTCQDPRHFFGFDLVQMLKSQTGKASLSSHPISYLALCNADELLPETAAEELAKILKSESKYPFLLDIQAVSVMVMSCLNTHDYQTNSSVNLYKDSINKLKNSQSQDGSFGNVYTTAIVTQALLSANQENSKDWKLKETVKFLMEHLNSTSVDFLASYLILPILNGKSLVDIKKTNCTNISQYSSEGEALNAVKSRLGAKIRVQYSLYIGDDKDIIHTISLRVPEKVSVFEVMQLAQVADSKYRFQWKKMGEKIYVYEIDGITNDFEDGKFWMLYIGNNTDSMTHSLESPGDVPIKDNEQLVMWYKKTDIQ